MKNLPNDIWRIEKRGEYPPNLVGPGYYVTVDKDVTAREAVPKRVDGPFRFHNNGYGILQIMDKKNRLVAAVIFGSFLRGERTEDENVNPEEALWLAQTITSALNGALGVL